MQMSDQFCNCGKPVRYMVGKEGEQGSCNKYIQCPTYEQLKQQRDDLRALCLALATQLDGTFLDCCALCLHSREPTPAGTSYQNDCTNPDCISQEIGRLLPERRKPLHDIYRKLQETR